jgi:hypothetical protein
MYDRAAFSTDGQNELIGVSGKTVTDSVVALLQDTILPDRLE